MVRPLMATAHASIRGVAAPPVHLDAEPLTHRHRARCGSRGLQYYHRRAAARIVVGHHPPERWAVAIGITIDRQPIVAVIGRLAIDPAGHRLLRREDAAPGSAIAYAGTRRQVPCAPAGPLQLQPVAHVHARRHRPLGQQLQLVLRRGPALRQQAVDALRDLLVQRARAAGPADRSRRSMRLNVYRSMKPGAIGTGSVSSRNFAPPPCSRGGHPETRARIQTRDVLPAAGGPSRRVAAAARRPRSPKQTGVAAAAVTGDVLARSGGLPARPRRHSAMNSFRHCIGVDDARATPRQSCAMGHGRR